MTSALLMERPRVYCFAKSLDLAVIKLTHRETEATLRLLDLLILQKCFFFLPLSLILIRTICLLHFFYKCTLFFL